MRKPTLPELLKRVWRILMTPVGRRIPVPGRKGKGAPHGIALLVVLLSLALMSAVVTDLGANEMIRYRLASNDRDAMKAQALAESATNLARLLLAMQDAVQPLITQLSTIGIPLPAHTFWQLVPLDSDLLQGLTSGELQSTLGLDVSAALEERRAKREELAEEKLASFDKEKEGAGKGPFEPPEGGFGYFNDEKRGEVGSFRVEIQDEEQKAASLRGWATAVSGPEVCFARAQRLFEVVANERYDFLFEDRDAVGNRTDRFELVANIYDWVDENREMTDGRAEKAQWCRGLAGSEDSVYSSGYKVEPKNAYFDSPGELRLVRGMSDAHMRAFADEISIYAEGKVNILSAPTGTVEALVRACAQPGDPLVQNPVWMAETLSQWETSKMLGVLGGGFPPTPDGFLGFLDMRGLAAVDSCKDQIGTASLNFTVKATATVGEVTRTMTTVYRVHRQAEELYYYAVR